MDPLTLFLATLGAAVLSDLRARRGDKVFRFVGACPEMTGPLIDYITDYRDTGSQRRIPTQQISYTTFARYADLDELRRDDHGAMWNLSKNWTVTFWKAQLPSGQPLFYFDWSGMEHLFVAGGWDNFDLARETELAKSELQDEGDRVFIRVPTEAWRWWCRGGDGQHGPCLILMDSWEILAGEPVSPEPGYTYLWTYGVILDRYDDEEGLVNSGDVMESIEVYHFLPAKR